MKLSSALAEARRRLRAAEVETPGLDVRVLAKEAFGLDAAAMIAAGEEDAGEDALAAFRAMVDRRAIGEPVGRILGRREFYGLDLRLSAETLEPRPDTETLVDVALTSVRAGRVPGASADGAGLLFADIGTGSGAIAIALAVALPRSRGIACDISTGALATARANAAAHGVTDRLTFHAGEYLAPLVEPCGLIVSNPPYIESAAIDQLARDVRDHDPHLALDGGPDGLAAYRSIASAAAAALLPGGMLAVEIGAAQGETVLALFSAAGLANRAVHTDLGGRQRVVTAHSPVVQGTFIPGL